MGKQVCKFALIQKKENALIPAKPNHPSRSGLMRGKNPVVCRWRTTRGFGWYVSVFFLLEESKYNLHNFSIKINTFWKIHIKCRCILFPAFFACKRIKKHKNTHGKCALFTCGFPFKYVHIFQHPIYTV